MEGYKLRFSSLNDTDMPVCEAVLYETVIVRTEYNGITTLNNGGWFTAHTKKAMNATLRNHAVFQRKGEWFIRNLRNNDVIPYFNGITIND